MTPQELEQRREEIKQRRLVIRAKIEELENIDNDYIALLGSLVQLEFLQSFTSKK